MNHQDIKTLISNRRRGRASASGALIIFLALVIGVALVVRMSMKLSAAFEARQTPTTSPADSAQAHLAHGAALYTQYCRTCHGDNGLGDGPAAVMLDPRPRNFHLGQYRLITTNNSVPTHNDLMHTIRHGMAGTSMPAWMALSDGEVEALADYVFSLSRQSLRDQLATKGFKGKKLETIVDARLTPSGVLTVPPETSINSAGLARGKELYLQTCAKCHGDMGEGRQDPSWKTAEGFPIASRAFTSGVFKGGGKTVDLYTRVYGGMPGSPMPGFGGAYKSDDLWSIVHYVQTLARLNNMNNKTVAQQDQSASLGDK